MSALLVAVPLRQQFQYRERPWLLIRQLNIRRSMGSDRFDLNSAVQADENGASG